MESSGGAKHVITNIKNEASSASSGMQKKRRRKLVPIKEEQITRITKVDAVTGKQKVIEEISLLDSDDEGNESPDRQRTGQDEEEEEEDVDEEEEEEEQEEGKEFAVLDKIRKDASQHQSFYRRFRFEGHDYKVGDHVIMLGTGGLNYLGIVEAIVSQKKLKVVKTEGAAPNKKKQRSRPKRKFRIRVRWFHQKCDLDKLREEKKGLTLRAPFRTAGKVPQEVYWSFDWNNNPITSVVGPAKVIYCPAATDPYQMAAVCKKEPNTFFCRYIFADKSLHHIHTYELDWDDEAYRYAVQALYVSLLKEGVQFPVEGETKDDDFDPDADDSCPHESQTTRAKRNRSPRKVQPKLEPLAHKGVDSASAKSSGDEEEEEEEEDQPVLNGMSYTLDDTPIEDDDNDDEDGEPSTDEAKKRKRVPAVKRKEEGEKRRKTETVSNSAPAGYVRLENIAANKERSSKSSESLATTTTRSAESPKPSSPLIKQKLQAAAKVGEELQKKESETAIEEKDERKELNKRRQQRLDEEMKKLTSQPRKKSVGKALLINVPASLPPGIDASELPPGLRRLKRRTSLENASTSTESESTAASVDGGTSTASAGDENDNALLELSDNDMAAPIDANPSDSVPSGPDASTTSNWGNSWGSGSSVSELNRDQAKSNYSSSATATASDWKISPSESKDQSSSESGWGSGWSGDSSSSESKDQSSSGSGWGSGWGSNDTMGHSDATNKCDTTSTRSDSSSSGWGGSGTNKSSDSGSGWGSGWSGGSSSSESKDQSSSGSGWGTRSDSSSSGWGGSGTNKSSDSGSGWGSGWDSNDTTGHSDATNKSDTTSTRSDSSSSGWGGSGTNKSSDSGSGWGSGWGSNDTTSKHSDSSSSGSGWGGSDTTNKSSDSGSGSGGNKSTDTASGSGWGGWGNSDTTNKSSDSGSGWGSGWGSNDTTSTRSDSSSSGSGWGEQSSTSSSSGSGSLPSSSGSSGWGEQSSTSTLSGDSTWSGSSSASGSEGWNADSSRSGGRSGGGGGRGCFKCGESGHMARECPNAGAANSGPLPEVGSVCQGQVMSLGQKDGRPFGVFVRPVGCNQDGLVHFTHVSKTRVEPDTDDLLALVGGRGAIVNVKVLDVKEDGGRTRISLSIKEADQPEKSASGGDGSRDDRRGNDFSNHGDGGGDAFSNSRGWNTDPRLDLNSSAPGLKTNPDRARLIQEAGFSPFSAPAPAASSFGGGTNPPPAPIIYNIQPHPQPQPQPVYMYPPNYAPGAPQPAAELAHYLRAAGQAPGGSGAWAGIDLNLPSAGSPSVSLAPAQSRGCVLTSEEKSALASVPYTLDDINSILLGRRTMMRWYRYERNSFNTSSLRGLLVRVMREGHPCIGEIVEAFKTTPYYLSRGYEPATPPSDPDALAAAISDRILIRVTFKLTVEIPGVDEGREYPAHHISTQYVTQQEMAQWLIKRKSMKSRGLLSAEKVAKKKAVLAETRDAIERRYRASERQEKRERANDKDKGKEKAE